MHTIIKIPISISVFGDNNSMCGAECPLLDSYSDYRNYCRGFNIRLSDTGTKPFKRCQECIKAEQTLDGVHLNV